MLSLHGHLCPYRHACKSLERRSSACRPFLCYSDTTPHPSIYLLLPFLSNSLKTLPTGETGPLSSTGPIGTNSVAELVLLDHLALLLDLELQTVDHRLEVLVLVAVGRGQGGKGWDLGCRSFGVGLGD